MGWEQDAVDALAQPALQFPAEAAHLLGHTYAWWLLALGLAARRRFDLALPLAAALVATDGLVFALKEAFARARPDGGMFGATGFAFPSGHAARAGMGAALAAGLGLPRPWVLLALAFAAAVALLRVAARAHWPTDVLAGLALGTAVGAGVAGAWQRDVCGVRTRALAALARAAPLESET